MPTRYERRAQEQVEARADSRGTTLANWPKALVSTKP